MSSNESGPVGVVLCRCGRLMEDWVDVGALARRAGPDPRAAFVREQTYSCFGEGLAAIVEAARSGPVLVAACAPALHGPTLARALAAAGLPEDRARLVDVRGEGWAARAKARGAAGAEALLADALAEVELPAEPPAMVPRVCLVGGSAAGDEAAALLEAGGVGVDWLDDAVESAGDEPTAMPRVERIAGGFAIERPGAERLEAGAIVLAFAPMDADAGAISPAFEPGARVITLAQAETALGELDDAAEEGAGPETAPATGTASAPQELPATAGLAPASATAGLAPASATAGGAAGRVSGKLPGDEPGVVALITGCIAGAGRARRAGVQLARVVELALGLRERWPRARLVVFHGDDAGAPPGLEALLRSFRREAGGLTVRGSVHRGVYTEGSIMVHATDADLGKRLMLAADLCVVDAGLKDDPRAAAWCTLLGIPDAEELAAGGVFTRAPGVLVASGSEPLSSTDAALRGAACAAHVLARLGPRRQPASS